VDNARFGVSARCESPQEPQSLGRTTGKLTLSQKNPEPQAIVKKRKIEKSQKK
jgi:hypothetical protein